MRTLILDLPGLSTRLLNRLSPDHRPRWCNALIEQGVTRIEPALPAVTMVAQATYTTGVAPQAHGVVFNGFCTHRRIDLHAHLDRVSFPEHRKRIAMWEQSNALLSAPRIWGSTPPPPGEAGRGYVSNDKPTGRRVAMLFFQSSIGAADLVVTPKPAHTPDGQTVSDCWTQPRELNDQLTAQLGRFPLHHYWGPPASIHSTKWIIAAAMHVHRTHHPDLQLTYIPHLDYGLQRLGPDDPRNVDDLAEVLNLLTPLVEAAQADGAKVILLSEYGMTSVHRSCPINVHLRRAGLLQVTPGHEVDYDRSAAFAVADHQVAHVYCADDAAADRVCDLLKGLDEVDAMFRGQDRAAVGLDTDRAGDVVAFTKADAWFEYRWWNDFAEAPPFAWTVDIHRKPGYDPLELFADPVRRRIRADEPQLVRGSHGRRPEDPADWPVLIGASSAGPSIPAARVAQLILS